LKKFLRRLLTAIKKKEAIASPSINASSNQIEKETTKL
jgi:hypothetical protein